MSPTLRTRIACTVYPSAGAAALAVADELRARLAGYPSLVLGLPTGNTPVPFYQELSRLHRAGLLSLAQATSFNLDEYLGLAPGDPRSFRAWMQTQLFSQVDLPANRTHLPDPVEPAAAPEESRRYEQLIREVGGIDWMLLGIGRNGHIGFNEPGSARTSRTRLVELEAKTIADAAKTFGGEQHVPRRAITMGIGTILEARAIRVMAFGSAKAEIVQRALTAEPTELVPASLLAGHADVRFLLDAESAQLLGQ
ncbi:MAG: glucosamine-6-phosphate deaminase [Planctomycetia bacterium]